MKKIKVAVTALVLCVLLATLVGCGAGEKKFEYEKYGFSITLTDEFVEDEMIGQKIYLKSTKIVFLSNYETKSTLSNIGINCNSAMEYANAFVSYNELTSTPVEDTENGWVLAEYSATVDGTDFTYYAYIIASGDKFWANQFCIETKNVDSLKADIEKYAKSIVLTA